MRSLHYFIFWGVMGQPNSLVAPRQKEKKELGRYFVSLLTLLLLITWPQ